MLVRLSGKWPVSLYVPEKFSAAIPFCPHCREANIDVGHVLGRCRSGSQLPATVNEPQELFNQNWAGGNMQSHMLFVAQNVHQALAANFWAHGPTLDDNHDRIEAWIQEYFR